MKFTRIDDTFAVASQPRPDEIAGLKADGAVLLVNNRPEGEEPGQPSSAAERAAAEAAGLDYRHLPVTGPTITRADVERFRAWVAQAEGPVVAHCRSGTRSLILWTIGAVLEGRMRRVDVGAFGDRHGIDLAGAQAWLDAHAPEAG